MTVQPRTQPGLTHGALRVPEVAAVFWVLKSLSTAMGEATSDYLVRVLHPIPAVLTGFAAFLLAMSVQLTRRRFIPWSYWTAIVMVGVFGTMAADVLHVGFGVPYIASTLLWAVALAGVFLLWHQLEGTLSIHEIDTTRRELFYWSAVIATFALGTSAGDLTAVTFNLGYKLSILLFLAIIAVPIAGYFRFRWNPVAAFWFAYVATRPVGATIADWLVKPTDAKGLGWPEGPVCLALTLAIALLVAYVTLTKPSGASMKIRRRQDTSIRR